VLDTTCPLCSAPHARKLSIIHSEGLSTVNISNTSQATTNTVGKITTSSTGLSTGIQQTSQSRSAACPSSMASLNEINALGLANKRQGVLIVGFTCSALAPFVIKLFTGESPPFWMTVLTGLAVTATIAFFSSAKVSTQQEHLAHQKLVDQRQEEINNWSLTFACNSCGNRFIPIEVNN
jgi:hypothetical protein